jgi:hypothetical protein
VTAGQVRQRHSTPTARDAILHQHLLGGLQDTELDPHSSSEASPLTAEVPEVQKSIGRHRWRTRWTGSGARTTDCHAAVRAVMRALELTSE